jgi:hypothetical protein
MGDYLAVHDLVKEMMAIGSKLIETEARKIAQWRAETYTWVI